MKKKQILTLVLTLVLSLCMLTACGNDTPKDTPQPDFTAVLNGENADLTYAADAQVKDGAITGLLVYDDITWTLELPADGSYSFDMEYAMADSEKQSAALYVCNMDTHEEEALTFSFSSTGSWNKTAVSSVSVTLPAGSYYAELIANEDGDSERFVDIFKIDVSGTFQNEAGQETTEAPTGGNDAVTGNWWVRPENYVSEGISLLDIFQLEDGGDTAVCYDDMGQVVRELGASWGKDTVTLSDEFGESTLLYDGQTMRDAEDGEVEFVRTNDPGFRKVEGYDGVWYLDGDPNASVRYQFSGQNYTHYFTDYTGDTSAEGVWEYGANAVMLPDGSRLEILPEISLPFPEPSLKPILGGRVLLEEDMFDFNIFVREDAVEDDAILDKAKRCLELADVWRSWRGNADGQELSLRFLPGYFTIAAAVEDESGNLTTDPEIAFYSGTWDLTDVNTIHLVYTDGTEENVDISSGIDSLTLATVGADFIVATN